MVRRGPLHAPLVANVTAGDVQAFLERKRLQGVTARTVNLYRANLHRVFHLCLCPWLLIPSNPVAAVEPLRHEAREPHAARERLHEPTGGVWHPTDDPPVRYSGGKWAHDEENCCNYNGPTWILNAAPSRS